MAAILYLGARPAIQAHAVITGPNVSLAFRALPWYAFLSTLRMAAAFALSFLFSLTH